MEVVRWREREEGDEITSTPISLSFLSFRGIEIRALEQKIQVQTVRMPEAIKFITSSQ